MNSAALRTLIIYAIVLPLAVFIGWITIDLAHWDRTSFATIAVIVFVLLLPAMLKWHYPLLVLSVNSAITVFFLPGKPGLWAIMAGINFGIAILQRIIQKRPAFHSVPAVTISLVTLGLIVLITAKLRGGMGVAALGGGSVGGKGYYFIVAGILAYFAFASQSIPLHRAKFYIALFFFPGLVSIVSHLIYFAGPSFYFLYLVFPMGFAAVQAVTEHSGIVRVAGFWGAATAVSYYLMSVHGIRGILKKWWRVLLVLTAVGLGALSGFRSMLVMIGLVVVVLFVMEGLLRSPMFPALVLAGVVGIAGLGMVSLKLPASIQRTLSFLPIKVNPIVEHDAKASVDWRIRMWKMVLPDLPKYVWMGKGYAINPTDYYLAQQAMLRGRGSDRGTSIMAGDYHNGPLSVYVPFGLPGFLAFLGFVFAAIRSLHLNYRYGPEELRNINRFLLAYFCARLIFFMVFFGSLYSDLFQFTTVLGLSVALNHGVCRKPALARQPAPSLKFGRATPLPEPA